MDNNNFRDLVIATRKILTESGIKKEQLLDECKCGSKCGCKGKCSCSSGGKCDCKKCGMLKEQIEDEQLLNELDKSTLGSYIKKAAHSYGLKMYNAGNSKNQGGINARRKGINRAVNKLTKEDQEFIGKWIIEEIELNEASVTKKHFQMVADLLKEIPDMAKRQEMANHHSKIFKMANPNFKKELFHKAAGTDPQKEN